VASKRERTVRIRFLAGALPAGLILILTCNAVWAQEREPGKGAAALQAEVYARMFDRAIPVAAGLLALGLPHNAAVAVVNKANGVELTVTSGPPEQVLPLQGEMNRLVRFMNALIARAQRRDMAAFRERHPVPPLYGLLETGTITVTIDTIDTGTTLTFTSFDLEAVRILQTEMPNWVKTAQSVCARTRARLALRKLERGDKFKVAAAEDKTSVTFKFTSKTAEGRKTLNNWMPLYIDSVECLTPPFDVDPMDMRLFVADGDFNGFIPDDTDAIAENVADGVKLSITTHLFDARFVQKRMTWLVEWGRQLAAPRKVDAGEEALGLADLLPQKDVTVTLDNLKTGISLTFTSHDPVHAEALQKEVGREVTQATKMRDRTWARRTMTRLVAEGKVTMKIIEVDDGTSVEFAAGNAEAREALRMITPHYLNVLSRPRTSFYSTFRYRNDKWGREPVAPPPPDKEREFPPPPDM
jgi:hypothetical protein